MVASTLVQGEWRARVAAEYASAAITTQLTHWLLLLGTSPDLVDDAHAIIGDELLHARLSHEVSIEAGGGGPPRLQPETLQLHRRGGESLRTDVCRACVRIFCVNETIAVPLFATMRKSTTVPTARVAIDQILRDEVRHRAFGWTLLEWLIDTGQGNERGIAAEEARREIAERRTHARAALERGGPETDAQDTAWGLISPRQYAEVVQATIERELVPRFAELDIDLGAVSNRTPR